MRSLVGLVASSNLVFSIPSRDSITAAETSLALEIESSVVANFADLCVFGHFGSLFLRFGNRKLEDQIQKFKVGCVLGFDTMVNRDVFRDRQIIVPNQFTGAMTGFNGADS